MPPRRQPKIPPLDAAAQARFWRKVDMHGPVPAHAPHLGPCWLWTAARDQNGYGRMKVKGLRAPHAAHRISFFLKHRRQPNPCALHECDNPPCVRPSHLFEGTKAANTADMVAKGRDRHGRQAGSASPSARLTDAQVARIREEAAAGARQTALGRRFGVATSTVHKILHFQTWKDPIASSL